MLRVFFSLRGIISYYIVYLIIYREKIKRCSLVSRGCVPHLGGAVWYLVGVFLISWVQLGISWVRSSSRGCSLVSRGCVPHLVGAVWYLVGVFLI
nr:MAG TPA: hypothetical protein [Caudoviricetes sp.]